MRFMLLYKPGFESDAPPTPENMAKVGKLIEDMAKSGVLLATDGLMSSKKGARVAITNGKLTVTDGPFTEAKELIGGFAIVNVKSKEEAVEQAKNFLTVMGVGESEVRQMHDAPAFDATQSPAAQATARR